MMAKSKKRKKQLRLKAALTAKSNEQKSQGKGSKELFSKLKSIVRWLHAMKQ
jgi:hypothetical protein